MNIYTASLTLFFVMDPLGNIPVFLSVLAKIDPQKRRKIVLRECIFAFLVLVAFLFFGDDILLGLGITQPALSIAGGIILFLISIKMIFPPDNHDKGRDQQDVEPFVVPLAIPLIAGPSAIATVMLFATETSLSLYEAFVALLIASLITTIILLSATQLRRWLGQKGLIAIERLMGMILTTIAVQMFLSGLVQYINAHHL